MTYNLAHIRDRVRVDKLDDEEYDSNVVDNFINDTQREIFNEFELPFQEKIFTGTIPSSTVMFSLPDDLAEIQSQSLAGVTKFSQGEVRWRDFFESFPDRESATPSAPSYWTLYARNIVFNAPTDKPYELTLFYIRKPLTLSGDTDVPEIPEEFEELLVLGAYIRVLKRNEDFDLAAQESMEYQRQLGLLVDRYGFRKSGPIKMQNSQI